VTTTPVLFDRRLFGELRSLDGDTGARRILQAHAPDGRVVEFPAWRGQDIDSEADYVPARETWKERGDESDGRSPAVKPRGSCLPAADSRVPKFMMTREILEGLRRLLDEPSGAALATITRTSGSTYQREGAKMLCLDDRTLIGSVSGGCLEADVAAA